MCQAISTALVAQLQVRFPAAALATGDWVIEDEVRHFYQASDPYLAREMALDYHDEERLRRGAPTALQEARDWAKDDAYVPQQLPPEEARPQQGSGLSSHQSHQDRLAAARGGSAAVPAPQRGQPQPTDAPSHPTPARVRGETHRPGRFSQEASATGP